MSHTTIEGQSTKKMILVGQDGQKEGPRSMHRLNTHELRSEIFIVTHFTSV